MTAHFTLDIDPEAVRTAARRLRRIIAAVEALPAPVLATPQAIGDQWTGRPADRVKGEMTTLGTHLDDAAPLLRDAHRALKDLAGAYDQALDQLPALNGRWAEALEDHASAVNGATDKQAEDLAEANKGDQPADQDAIRSINDAAAGQIRSAGVALAGTQRLLTHQFGGVRDDARRATRKAAGVLREAVVVRASWWDQFGARFGVGPGRPVNWADHARAKLGDLTLAAGHYAAEEEAEAWEEALSTYGLPVPATFDFDRGDKLAADLDDLLAEVEHLGPAQRSERINEWAKALSPEDLALLAVTDSARVGNLDGIPNKTRYAANRLNVATAIESEQAKFDHFWDPPPTDTDPRWAEYVRHRDRISTLEGLLEDKANKPPHQVLAFVPPTYEGDAVVDDGRLAVVVGDLDTARLVGTVVPGITNRIDNFGATLEKATNIQGMAPQSATIAWLGYDTPELADAASSERALEGGQALRDFLDGTVRHPDSESVPIAHSYGTRVLAEALKAGALPDRAIVFGSPGFGEEVTHKDHLGMREDIPIYALRAPGDAVSISAGHGMDPVDMPGIIRLDTDWRGPEDVTGHSSYTNAGSDSLRNIAHAFQSEHPPKYWHKMETEPWLVTGGNALADDGFAGEYNQNVRDLVDILQKEVPPHVLQEFVSTFEHEIQNHGEGGNPLGSIDDAQELLGMVRQASENSGIGDHLTADEFGDALVEAGFVDKAATDAGDWVERRFDDMDALDDVRVPVPMGPGRPPIMVPLPDGINEWVGDRAGGLTEDAVRGAGEWSADRLPGLGDVLDGAETVVDSGVFVRDRIVDGVELGIQLENGRREAQRRALEAAGTTRDIVLDRIRNLDPEDFRLRNPRLPWGNR